MWILCVQIKWHQVQYKKQPESETWGREREGAGSDFSSLTTTFESQQVSFRIVISLHFKRIQRSYSCILDCRIVFIHIIIILSLFKNLFTVQNVCLYVCTEQSCYFFLFLFWMLYIYKEILQVWYFMVSTTVHFLYLQTLFKKINIKLQKIK